jgi:hypothetical protein
LIGRGKHLLLDRFQALDLARELGKLLLEMRRLRGERFRWRQGFDSKQRHRGAVKPWSTRRRPDCVAGHVRFEVRRETGKE